MKKMVFILVAAPLLFISGAYGQPTTTKMATASPTPANVLKWTKEVLPKMERLVPKLDKIKAETGKRGTDALRLLAQVNHLKEIKAKGSKLTAAEATRYYDLVVGVVNSFYIDCQAHNGNVCCVDCHDHGFLGIWCFANCFVLELPPGN